MTKGSEFDVLLRGIREVAQDRQFVSPDVASKTVQREAVKNRTTFESLGHREFQVFVLIAQGASIEACARELGLSEKTVRSHLTQVKAEPNVPSTAEMTRLAIRAGIADP